MHPVDFNVSTRLLLLLLFSVSFMSTFLPKFTYTASKVERIKIITNAVNYNFNL